MKNQFGRLSSIEYVAMAGVFALCAQIMASRIFLPNVHEKLQAEIKALEIVDSRRTQLDNMSLRLTLIDVDDRTVRLDERDCKYVRSIEGRPQKLLDEFLQANATFYSYHMNDPLTPQRQEYDTNAMRRSAQESDRMIVRRLNFCS